MTPLTCARVWVGAGLLSAGAIVLSAQAVRAQQAAADDPRFTGKSDVMESKDLSLSRRRFDPAARLRRGFAFAVEHHGHQSGCHVAAPGDFADRYHKVNI